jgi:predicted enzyme related to lactoylglutathione lyase
MTSRICFVELPARETGAMKAFYAGAFGFAMTDFGPSYACTLGNGVDLGVQADASEVTDAPLAVILVDNLVAAQAAVETAGGTVTRAIFAFPGGRRFHFRDPAGNELSAMQAD